MATYSNSPLVAFKLLSPCNSGQRSAPISRITPHCVVGQCTVESLGSWFSFLSTKASSNYGIGKDGRIGLYVEEKNRAWTTSSSENDRKAVTIECASDTTHPYAMTNEVYKSLIALCVDICRRNGKTHLLWFGDKAKALSYVPKATEMVLTVHRWYANKSCPGDWLYSRLGDLAEKVTAQLGGSSKLETDETTTGSSDHILLSLGAAGEIVRAIQEMLNKVDDAGLLEDGDFGPCTRAAVYAFQRANGLDPDGIVGPLTMAKLESIVSGMDSKPAEKIGTNFLVRVSIDDLNIRSGPGASFESKGFICPGAYTIVEEQTAGGLQWGKLKSGAGWICLMYTTAI